jgi:hypothetical protein
MPVKHGQRLVRGGMGRGPATSRMIAYSATTMESFLRRLR